MNSVEKVKAELKKQKIPVSKMERELGFANGYIGQLKKAKHRYKLVKGGLKSKKKNADENADESKKARE